MPGLTRFAPAALGLATVLFVAGVVAGPVLGVGDDDDSSSNDAAGASTTTTAPATTTTPVPPPVEDLATVLLDFTPWGFTPLVDAGPPFDGPVDVVEAGTFADVDATAEQQRLTDAGFTRGHAALWTKPDGSVAVAIVYEFATPEAARAEFDEKRRLNLSVSPVFEDVEGVPDAFQHYSLEDDLEGFEGTLLAGNRLHSLVVLHPILNPDEAEFLAVVTAQADLTR